MAQPPLLFVSRFSFSPDFPYTSHMAFISYPDYDPDKIDKEPAEVIEKWYGKVLRPANIIGVSGCHPKAMDGHMTLYRALMFSQSPLSRSQREMIAVVVSGINGCHY